MKKLILCVSLVCAGLMTSCVDKNEEVDPDNGPSWLGSSIYEELKNPDQSMLTGTFNTYLRLVDDLGYASTLSRTGSKTVFPANDEAFERFFQNNSWGVSSYEQLSIAQKKLLLNSSMLDNALLVSMLSNVSNGSTSTSDGLAVKHQTNVSVIDSITHLYGPADMPRNNSYWTKYYDKGIDLVSDNTRPMMVHFTNAQMVNNSISTSGSGSDFEILTGAPYTDGAAYIFDDPIINSDITCQNGYIHQLKNVLVPPGNMPQVLRQNSETSLFSRVLDYFAAPYFDQVTTNNYNDWAVQNNQPVKDSIFQMRYFSSRSQNTSNVVDPNGNSVGTSFLLWDPGWNQYYPSHANVSSLDYSITDIGAMFVPDDAAFEKYFLPGGDGAYLINIYGDVPNTKENLASNLDALQNKKPEILTSFVRNLMKTSFVETVPSKFSTIINDASENMGMNLNKLKKNGEGKYDIKIANNGVIYVLNDMIVPDEYRAVLAPASSYPDMKVMNWLISVSDDGNSDYLGVDFNKYLLAMSANYALFIPEDNAFSNYGGGFFYVDPASLGKAQPEALRIYYDEDYKANHRTTPLAIERYKYNKTTGQIGDLIATVSSPSNRKTQLIDILNYHTVLLDAGETIDGSKHYYQTKHGGEIYVASGASSVGTDAQHGSGAVLPVAAITTKYPEANGIAYRVDHVIQSSEKSVSRILQDNSQFSEFYEACSGFSASDVLKKAGISDDQNSFGTTEQDQYVIFTTSIGTGTNKVNNACVDENVKMFNTYNYTLYAPDNEAMDKAYAAGLPRWSDIQAELEPYEDEASVPENVKADAKAKINAIREFCRYHFQSGSVYADGNVAADIHQSLLANSYGVADEYSVGVSNGTITVRDGAGQTHSVSASGGLLVNQMARDIWLGNAEGSKAATKTSAEGIYTSSFCAVHEISTPFYLHTRNGSPSWSPSAVAGSAAKKHYYSKRRR